MSFGPAERPVVEKSQAVAADTSTFSTQQIADLLAVVMWAGSLSIDEIASAQHRARLGLNMVIWLESLLVSVRPIAHSGYTRRTRQIGRRAVTGWFRSMGGAPTRSQDRLVS
jgi:hypothetical protein